MGSNPVMRQFSLTTNSSLQTPQSRRLSRKFGSRPNSSRATSQCQSRITSPINDSFVWFQVEFFRRARTSAYCLRFGECIFFGSLAACGGFWSVAEGRGFLSSCGRLWTVVNG